MVHQADGGKSTVSCSDGLDITGCMVLDATGHARSLVEFDEAFDPGYQVSQVSAAVLLLSLCIVPYSAAVQAAYGIIAEVNQHPFDLDTVLFMDWRDDHFEGHSEMQAANA